MAHTLKIEIDRNLCIGSSTCERLAPMGFKRDEQGIAVAINIESIDEETLREAEMVCPSGAIRIIE